MPRAVSADAKERTTKCDCTFACLQCKEDAMCPISAANGPDTLYLAARPLHTCRYALRLSTGYMCECPTRYGLYRSEHPVSHPPST